MGGGTCATVNPLIWRRGFDWTQADAHATGLLELWRRLLVTQPGTVVETRLCRGRSPGGRCRTRR
ncbi:hypothetical protein ACFQYP_45395 [Nonomuraea antimicrobica]